MIAFDDLDRRLVTALQVSPRATWGEIGSAVGEHERTVARRLQRLLAIGAVRVTVILDELRCGLGTPMHLHVQVDPCTTEQVAEALSARPDTRSVYAVTGSADIGCELVAPSRELLHEILTTQIPATPGIVQTRTQVVLHTFQTVAEWHAPYLSEEQIAHLKATGSPPAGPLPERVDPTAAEKDAVGLLAADGRIGFTALAERLDVSVPTARRRVAALLERGVVHLRAEVEPALLGLEVEAQLWLSVRAHGLDQVGQTLAGHPSVRYCAATSGTHTMIVQVVATHEAELYRFLTTVVGPLDDVTDVNITLITRAYKRGHLRKSGLLTLEYQ
ncbi:Lrp/AsnC family transcriptional regulator [Streptosporangium sp. NBC_01639]|uniref:Lrp/AsnC family transcriptional regulator n=1 Tax=unclassified Streptosporangium TaxID=2632669 RepID=UPI002DD930CF|nr:Lrp/AsnC family transcriptional regulator [Streptosporangium sp. NBC_01756]WSC85834.1 Lrp/AsnC family transcriptional regulator [Streptosporangium sp. NBC_01756]WTD55492.1 Lrp/AsnC family transcriptional regulator [Streptosporangium sp. NBC_01639]